MAYQRQDAVPLRMMLTSYELFISESTSPLSRRNHTKCFLAIRNTTTTFLHGGMPPDRCLYLHTLSLWFFLERQGAEYNPGPCDLVATTGSSLFKKKSQTLRVRRRLMLRSMIQRRVSREAQLSSADRCLRQQTQTRRVGSQ